MSQWVARLRRAAPYLAPVAGAGSVALGVAALAVHGIQGPDWSADVDPFWHTVVVWCVVVGGVGALLARFRPEHPFGWLAVLAGWLLGSSEVVLVVAALSGPPGVDRWLLWLGSWLWLPGYALLATVALTLLPDGRLPSPRWRPVLVAQTVVVVVATALEAVTPWERLDPPMRTSGLSNPLEVAAVADVRSAGPALVAAAALVAVSALLLRVRSARGADRWRLLPIAVGAALAVAVALSAAAAPDSWGPWVAATSVVPLVAGIGLAVLQGELVGADAAIGRSVAYAALTAVVVAGYLAVVGAVGASVGGPTALLAIVLVGVTLHPAQQLVQRQVNRLLYGRRDDPTQVLAAFGQRLEGMGSAEPGGEGLPGLAHTLADTLRLPYVAVTVNDEVVSRAGSPAGVAVSERLVHRGEDVGELHVSPRRGEPTLSAADRRVLAGLRPALAAAVHSLRMTRDVVRSRAAIAEARDAERERLRRDLHDDVGPTLAALVMQLDLAREQVAADPAAAEALLDRIKEGVTGVVDSTRRIAHDLGPRDLDDADLRAALTEVVDRFSAGPVLISADLADTGPLSEGAETAILRATAEALANVVRHSGAQTCRVALGRENGQVTLTVSDDGIGITGAEKPGLGLRSLRARAEQLGGRCDIASPGPGTTVTLRLPAHAADGGGPA